MKRILCLLCACTMALTLLTGCGSSSTASSSSGSSDITFTVALDSDIVKLDPAFAYDFTTNPVVNQITEGLLTFNEKNELVPLLAKDWSMTDDKTYVYNIRDDVTFSDGTQMTMDDVLFSLNRTMDSATASYLQWMFSDVDSIEKTGDWQLTVHLKEPSATRRLRRAFLCCILSFLRRFAPTQSSLRPGAGSGAAARFGGTGASYRQSRCGR